MECEIIKNNKGDEKLCVDGYLYTKKKVVAGDALFVLIKNIHTYCRHWPERFLEISPAKTSVVAFCPLAFCPVAFCPYTTDNMRTVPCARHTPDHTA